MNLLQMSFSGAVIILVIVVIRAVAINRLPKKIFMILWGIALLRLLIPFSIPSAFSIYSVVERNIPDNIVVNMSEDNITSAESLQMNENKLDEIQSLQEDNVPFPVLPVIWFIGMASCTIFFSVSYIRCLMEFRTSIPVNEPYVKEWLKKHRLRRTISIRHSDKIVAPLTYGIFCPVILMPKRTDWQDTKHLKYVLLHEYVHICHYDSLLKLIATAVLCIHWFNPLVWVMYILFNRDIELACDENVVYKLGEKSKSAYALMLISMETQKSKLIPLVNNFSKNAIEERITAIMKIKKTSLLSILVGLMLIMVVIIACASTANATTTPNTQDNDNTLSGEEVVDDVISDNPNKESIQNNSSMTNSDLDSETINNEMSGSIQESISVSMTDTNVDSKTKNNEASEPTQEINSEVMPNNGDAEGQEQKEDVTNENAETEKSVANTNSEVENMAD